MFTEKPDSYIRQSSDVCNLRLFSSDLTPADLSQVQVRVCVKIANGSSSHSAPHDETAHKHAGDCGHERSPLHFGGTAADAAGIDYEQKSEFELAVEFDSSVKPLDSYDQKMPRKTAKCAL